MDMSVLIVAMIAAGVVLVLLVVLLLRGRTRTKVIAAPTLPAALDATVSDAPSVTASMTMAAADSVVRSMAARGDTIQAVKMVREMTGLGLKEAKDYVDALPNAPPITTIARQMAMAASAAPGSGASMRTEAAALVGRGQMIEAIKMVRERTGMGLKEAKDYVDNLAAGMRASAAGPRHPFDDPRLRQSVAPLLAGGQVDQAMRLIQSMTGCSIEAARNYIDRIRQG